METRSLVKIIILLLLCLVIHAYTMQGQTLYSGEASITVLPNTLLTVEGSVENEGRISNDGHLKVSGQWINSGVYLPGEGRVTFNGTSSTVPQIIHHHGQTFSSVTISGGTRKIILSDVVIGKEIHFDDGVVEGSGNSKVVFEDDVVILDASDRSHIHGSVVQLGAGRKLFPLGNGSIYLPVELRDIEDPSSSVAVQAFEFQNTSLSPGPLLKSISDQRYWHIDAGAGNLASARVVLPLRGESFREPERVVVVQSAAPAERFLSIGGSFQESGPVSGVVSAERVTMPFVALATMAEDDLVVFNAVSPNGDGANEFMRIANIENYPDNRLTVFNRWGDKVFEIEGYNNEDRSFNGTSNLHGAKELVTGSYFYVLEIPQRESLKGFLTLKRD